jgi:hypothetical protein
VRENHVSDPEELDEDWEARVREHVRPSEVASYVLWGTSGAALAAGIVMFVVDGRARKRTKTSWSMQPLLAPGTAGCAATLVW